VACFLPGPRRQGHKSCIGQGGKHDSKTEIRPVPPVFAQGQPENRQAQEPGYICLARGSRKARTRGAVLQAALSSAARNGCPARSEFVDEFDDHSELARALLGPGPNLFAVALAVDLDFDAVQIRT